jgi:polysaccharide export outer membrane protein
MFLSSRSRCSSIVVLISVAIAAAVIHTHAQGEVASANDVLRVTVVDQPTLSGKYTVNSDGTVMLPLVGPLRAGGLPVEAIETELVKRLANGYLKEPRLSVAIERSRQATAFVVGEVRQAGSYPLSADMTLIELLARAGWTTDKAANVVVVTRRRGAALPDRPADSARSLGPEVIRFNLRQLQAGTASAADIIVADGDTVFVPKAGSVYVVGEVKNPGTFAVEENTTVLQALALAGGLTERGSFKRVRIIHESDTEKKPVKADVNTIVQAGDTIVVGESLF